MRRLAILSTILGALLLAPSAVLAVPIPISGSSGLNGLGSFTGSFDYTPIDATHGTIDIVLDNTSATLGYITAFVFNLPDGTTVSAAPLSSPDNNLDVLLGGPTFSNTVNGAPFGQFDIGATTFGNFEGGGAPSAGIAPGFSGTFQFALTGTGLGALTPASFLSTLSDGSMGAGEGVEEFVVRFRGFAEGAGSDKVPVDITGEPIPEPGTMILLGLGLATLSARRLHSRKP